MTDKLEIMLPEATTWDLFRKEYPIVKGERKNDVERKIKK